MLLHFTPFPELITSRCLLRQLKNTDADQLFFIRNHEEINKYLNRPASHSKREVELFIEKINKSISENQSVYWVICDRQHHDVIFGTICLWNISPENESMEIGYELLPEFQGKGIMREAIFTVLDYAFHSIGVNQIQAFTHPENAASEKALLHFHFRRDHEMESAHHESNEMIFSLHAADFVNQ